MNDKKTLTKEDSLAIKGIAIIMLVFYHCFVNAKSVEKYDINFFPLGENLAFELVSCFKICVSVFAFISGYGLLKSYEKAGCISGLQTAKWEVSRAVKTLSGLWFVFVLVIIYSQALYHLPGKVYMGEGRVRGLVYMFLDAMGFADLFGTPAMTLTWWYMGAAVVYIVLLPVLYMLGKKVGCLSVAMLIVFLPRVLNVGFPGSTNPLSFLLAFFAGMCFSQYELFDKLQGIRIVKSKAADGVLRFVIHLAVLGGCFLLYLRLPWGTAWELHFAVCPVVFICFCRNYIVDIPVLRKILIFLGRYSMDIFLIHSLLKNRFFKDFIYSFRIFWLIPAVLMLMSLVFAIAVKYLKCLVRYEKGIQWFSNKIGRTMDMISEE